MSDSPSRRQRNGKIELLRFVFASAVLFYHVRPDAWDHQVTLFKGLQLFPTGKLGVEFFFILSGFFLAKSIDSERKRIALEGVRDDSLSDDTFTYVLRKIKAILPYHIPFCLAALAIGLYTHIEKNPVTYIINNIPTLFLLNSTGLVMGSKGLIAPEWYVSSMLLVLLVLYPLVKRFWTSVPLTVCPIIGFLCMGYITHTNGGFPGNIESWGGITLYSNLRALGEMSLGVSSYVLSAKLSGHTFAKVWHSLGCKALEVICYVTSILLMCTTLPNISQLVLLLLLVGVTISASSYGVGNNNPLLQNRVTLFLGAISLPVYLSQNVVRAVVRTMNLPIRGSSHFVLVVVLTYAVSVIAVLLNHRSTRPHHG